MEARTYAPKLDVTFSFFYKEIVGVFCDFSRNFLCLIFGYTNFLVSECILFKHAYLGINKKYIKAITMQVSV